MVHEADGFGVSGVDGPSGRPVLGMLALLFHDWIRHVSSFTTTWDEPLDM